MRLDPKILNEVITLQDFFHEGFKKATTLRAKLEEGLGPSPERLRREEITTKAVNKRIMKKRAKAAGKLQ